MATATLDIVTLVSQEWEEIYAFVNDGRGQFQPTRIWGATNEDFGSSWICMADLDQDGDIDRAIATATRSTTLRRPAAAVERRAVARESRVLTFAVHRMRLLGRLEPAGRGPRRRRRSRPRRRQRLQRLGQPAAQSLVWFENDGPMNFTLRPVTGSPTHLITLGTADLDRRLAASIS